MEATEHDLVAVYEELDVSGGTPLEKRAGLRAAVEAVEAGEASVLMVAYFDRLVRSLKVQAEVVSRVEAAGGRVLTLDFGEVSEATATQWLSGTMMGAMSEYYRRSVSERVRASQAHRVARGVMPSPAVPVGYRRLEGGRLEPDQLAPVIREAFEIRAAGGTIKQVRDHLRAHGIDRAYSSVKDTLANRIYLGEINFGKLSNPDAHEPIVDRRLFEEARRATVPRGRQPKSQRLLARLGVLRCGTCGGPMAVSHPHGRALYRCNPLSDCPRRMSISASIVEEVVIAEVKERLQGVVGEASDDEAAREADAAADAAQADLEAAIRAFGGVADEPAAQERLAELRRARDECAAHAMALRSRNSALRITADGDWDDLSLDGRRGLVRALIDRVEVFPGRGAERVRLTLSE